MEYRSYCPGPPLEGFVESLWSLSDAPPHARERILPSGTLELVINLHEDEFRIGPPGHLSAGKEDPMRSPLYGTHKRIATLVIAGALASGGGGTMTEASAATKTTTQKNATPGGAAIAAVRYQIKDVDRAIKFYTELLDFKLEQKTGAAFAMVSRGPLQLVLSGPGSSGARPMPDGQRQEPGGWNRIIVYVPDLDAQIQKLKTAGVHFRNTVEVGPGGKQIQVEDPDGNPIELHEGGAGATK